MQAKRGMRLLLLYLYCCNKEQKKGGNVSDRKTKDYVKKYQVLHVAASGGRFGELEYEFLHLAMCLFFHETFLCPTNALYTSQDSTGNHVSAASNALVQLQGENNLGLFYNIRARGKLSVGLDVALECKAIGCSVIWRTISYNANLDGSHGLYLQSFIPTVRIIAFQAIDPGITPGKCMVYFSFDKLCPTVRIIAFQAIDPGSSPGKLMVDRFQSWDLWVMGPPRFRCATLISWLKHQYLSETERKYNETTSTLLGLIDGLIANIKSKDTSLRDRELWYYNVTVRQLTDENGTMLHKGTLDYVLT
ncbi:hypothetical protein V6N11_053882 [Hibiscus sabdariffa]|uniref:Uncharacterized protein n=1 Tax=Hibiscus sabdariffa TaxID=183260 RepID=A0ABR2S2W3_9ROSI